MAAGFVELPLVPAEAGEFQVGVALEEAHGAFLGDFQNLEEVSGGAGEVGTQAPEGGAD